MMSLKFFSDIIFPVTLWPWVRLSLWPKWVPGVFAGRKAGRCVRLTTLPLSCAVVMKSGNLKYLELSGPLQASNGTALPLPLYVYLYIYIYMCVVRRTNHEPHVQFFPLFSSTLFHWFQISSSAPCNSASSNSIIPLTQDKMWRTPVNWNVG